MVVLVVTEQPELTSLVVRVTVLVPGVAYTTPVGLASVLVAGVAPLPKFQAQVTPVVVPWLVKSIGRPVHSGAVDAKADTGVDSTVTCCVLVCVQYWSAMVKVTVFTPLVVYSTPLGLSAADTGGLAPAPRFHEYDQLPPVLPVLVKLNGAVEHCGELDVKLAVGVWCIVIELVAVTAQPDVVSVAVRVTTFVRPVE